MIPNKQELFAELEATGEQTVRENLAQGVYAGKHKIELIHEWLRQKDEIHIKAATARAEAAASRAESVTAEQLRLTKCANIAAYIAAGAAVIVMIKEIVTWTW